MNRRLIAVIATAAVMAAVAVVAAEPSKDKTRMPQQVPATTPPGTISLEELGDARQLEPPLAGRAAPSATSTTAPLAGVRNWAAIDVNQDHAISPAEMEAFLKVEQNKVGGRPG